MTPVSSGSSEKYSKLRPPRGSRMRFAAPPRSTLKPFARASAPTDFGLEAAPAPGPRSRRGRDRTASRSPCRRDGRPRDWRRQALRPFPAARECRGAARRTRSLPSQSTRSVWACRPMAPRSRHGPAPASPARSFGRAPFARAGRQAGRRRSTAGPAPPRLRQGPSRQERRPQRRSARLARLARQVTPPVRQHQTSPSGSRCLARALHPLSTQAARPGASQAEGRKDVTQGAKRRSSPTASRRSRDSGDRADTGVPAASLLIFGSRRASLRLLAPAWR